MLRGRVTAAEGGVIADAAVWIARLDNPDTRLAETRTDSRGEFTLEIAAHEGLSHWIVKAGTPSGLEGCELLDLVAPSGGSLLRIQLRGRGENYDEPSLDAVDAWLGHRINRLLQSRENSAAKERKGARRSSRLQPAAWERLRETRAALGDSSKPEAPLLAAAALMRVGAWSSAAAVLASVTDPRVEHERKVLEGIRLNFLRRPEEARLILERALGDQLEDYLPQLELGRSAVYEEDWPTALQRLDPVLRDKKLAPYAHYLRARCLLALGDLEGAADEARLLTQKVKKKRLPVPVQSFVADVRGRLAEKSIQAVRSVMTQPLGELQKAVPILAKMDTSEPSGGEQLPVILKQVGANIEKFFRDFSTTAALEVIRQARLDSKGMAHSVRRAEMYYVFLQKRIQGRPLLEEYRGSGDGRLLQIGGLEDGYMVTSGFASSLIVFHPTFQLGMEYRYLGRQELNGRPVFVLGFAQRPGVSQGIGVFRSTSRRGSAIVYVQGVAWISADQHQILRMRTDLLEPLKEVALNRQTSEIDYRPHHFTASPKTFFLPSRVTVSIEWGRRRLRNEHIFSRFWLFNVDVESEEPVERKAAEALRSSAVQ
jgi:thioredoxin-like negative regulator of GroEL